MVIKLINVKENKMKKGLFKKIIGAVFKGVVKGLPFGNVGVELLETFNDNKNVVYSDEELKELKRIYLIQKYISIIVQALTILLLINSFFKNEINSMQFLEILNNNIKDTLSNGF